MKKNLGYRAVEERAQRLRAIQKLLPHYNGKDYGELIAQICLTHGLSRRTASEYLYLFSKSDIIRIEDGRITVTRPALSEEHAAAPVPAPSPTPVPGKPVKKGKTAKKDAPAVEDGEVADGAPANDTEPGEV